ncbi:hypothetical protein [Agromyces mangrovi Wang et al. 2018]|uniref:hypothetical protein n=1 Tax=Agromyces mangrovi TaxID=1858653 RepID=UPI00257367EA|nr:hypothetical protein [Agromyces mangrovi]BDZ65398.1 hypothetical protein GCM10025877_23360 [Agromyces mangrovi]
MSELTVEVAPATRVRRFITFRVLAVAIALLFLVGFGVWLSILTPWLALPDEVDHGWTRTPELHRLADSASSVLMAAIAAAAVLLAVRPRGRSGVTAWLLGLLAVVGVNSLVSSAIQGQDLIGAGVFTLGWLVVVVLLPYAFAPDRASLAKGGLRDASAPGTALTRVFVAVGVVGVLIAVTAVVWRLAGGVFENPQEDDVIGFVLYGLAFAVGGLQCARARAGWRTLAVILAAVAAYSVVAGLSLALG